MPSAYRHCGVASWLFRRLLGLTYLCAFWSLALQIDGLVGSEGIIPARGWIAGHDLVLRALPLAGTALAALAIAGIAPLPVFALSWALYLAVSNIAGEFLAYQWDSLLIETGLLALAVAPPRWRDRLRDADEPPAVGRLLLWWLLFRLMLGSGIAKLTSGDPSWRGLTAMFFHYETQPLPSPLAWYAAQLPAWAQQASTAAVLAIELGVPWLVLGGRYLRRFGAAVLIALQLLIALTGNYAFFNLLTIALSVMWLDDGALRRLGLRGPAAAQSGGWKRQLLPAAIAVVTVPVSASLLASQIGLPFPSPVAPLAIAIEPLRSVNAYGLFAVMTTERREIVIEGSADGTTWREYEFRHKPGSVDRAPAWVAPWQPRLDWQMWFAALSYYEAEPWFQRLLVRLREGAPMVLALVDSNPFPDEPPRFVRARLYRYTFTDRRDATGAWWRRELLGEYSPP
jgi:hypothetical protein